MRRIQHTVQRQFGAVLVGEACLTTSQMATTAVSGATVNEGNPSSAPLAGTRRQQAKGTFGNKTIDGSRRQVDNNGGDSPQRYEQD